MRTPSLLLASLLFISATFAFAAESSTPPEQIPTPMPVTMPTAETPAMPATAPAGAAPMTTGETPVTVTTPTTPAAMPMTETSTTETPAASPATPHVTPIATPPVTPIVTPATTATETAAPPAIPMSVKAAPAPAKAASLSSILQSELSSGTMNNTSLIKLSNGLSVLVKKDDRFPLVSLRLYVHAGSAYESAKDAGISHVLEHMVFKGTSQYPKGAIATAIEKTGGYLNAATSFDHTVYLTDMTSEHWSQGLEVLKDMAFHPTLDPEELEKEKDVIVAELQRGEDNPGQRLFRMAQAAALKNSAYQHPIIGYEETIRSFTSEGIQKYIDRYYQPQSMLLLICGNVEIADALAKAEATFGSLPNTLPVIQSSPVNPASGPDKFSLTAEEGPWKKVHLAIALPAPNQSDVRSPQLDVLAQLLGGDASSRLYRTYKYEKRLVDSISVGNYSFEHTGLFYIQVTLDANKIAPFWQAFTKDLSKIGSLTFSAEEIARAKLNVEDSLFRPKETLAGYASKLGHFYFFDRGEQGEENYLTALRNTNPANLSALLRDTFKAERASVVVVAPAKTAVPVGTSSLEDWMSKEALKNWKPTADSAAANAPDSAQHAETIDLGKGRTLILLPDSTLPYTSVTMMFAGGDSLLSPNDQGLAAFTASLLGKGNGKLSATAVEEFQSDRAASLSASTGKQSFTLSMNYPSRFTTDMFTLLQNTITAPSLKKEEAARVRETQTAAIIAQEDRPTSLAFRRMFPFFFAGHPYGYLAYGDVTRVAAFTEKDAAAFWQKQSKQPWVMAVCGSFDKTAILAAIDKFPVPTQEAPELATPQWGLQKNLDLALPGRSQSHLLMVFPTSGVGSADEPALDLLQNILAGQSGLLFRDLRDAQGLGYSVSAFSWKTQKNGALIFYIGTTPDKMEQAQQGFQTVIASLHSTPLATEEIDRGKQQMKGDYYRDHQALASRSSEAATLALLKRPLDTSKTTMEKAQNLTAKDLQELAEKYLKTENAYIVKVLP